MKQKKTESKPTFTKKFNMWPVNKHSKRNFTIAKISQKKQYVPQSPVWCPGCKDICEDGIKLSVHFNQCNKYKEWLSKRNLTITKLHPKKYLPQCPGCKTVCDDGIQLSFHFNKCNKFNDWLIKKRREPWKNNYNNHIKMYNIVSGRNNVSFKPKTIVRYK